MMKENGSWDNCKSLTKEELIHYLKENCWMAGPDSKDVDLFKYFFNSSRILKEIENIRIKNEPILTKLAIEADSLAVQINGCKTFKEQLPLIEKRSSVLKQFGNLHKEDEKLQKAYDNNRKLWDKHYKNGKEITRNEHNI